MFMNSNSLPIALMQSLVVTVPNLKWGDDDNVNAMVGRALTYLVLYSTLGMVVRIRQVRHRDSYSLLNVASLELWCKALVKRGSGGSGRPSCKSPD